MWRTGDATIAIEYSDFRPGDKLNVRPGNVTSLPVKSGVQLVEVQQVLTQDYPREAAGEPERPSPRRHTQRKSRTWSPISERHRRASRLAAITLLSQRFPEASAITLQAGQTGPGAELQRLDDGQNGAVSLSGQHRTRPHEPEVASEKCPGSRKATIPSSSEIRPANFQ